MQQNTMKYIYYSEYRNTVIIQILIKYIVFIDFMEFTFLSSKRILIRLRIQ